VGLCLVAIPFTTGGVVSGTVVVVVMVEVVEKVVLLDDWYNRYMMS